MRRTLKAFVGICVLAGASFITTSAAGAQLAPTPEGCDDYLTPCNPQQISFTYPRTVRAGQSMDIDGKVENVESKANRASTDEATIEMAGAVLGTAAIDTAGNFSGTFTVPAGLAVGDYTISATSGTLSTEGPITVVDDTGTNNNNQNNTSSNPLARTGFDATPMVTLGAAVLILGAAAVYGSKRRRVA